MEEAPSVSTSMWSMAAAGIWLTSTKFLAVDTADAAVGEPGDRLQDQRRQIPQLQLRATAVRWLSCWRCWCLHCCVGKRWDGFAQDLERVRETPFCSSCLASSAMTGTATASARWAVTSRSRSPFPDPTPLTRLSAGLIVGVRALRVRDRERQLHRTGRHNGDGQNERSSAWLSPRTHGPTAGACSTNLKPT